MNAQKQSVATQVKVVSIQQINYFLSLHFHTCVERNILSGPLEFFTSSSSSQQVCINSPYVWHALMKIQGVPSFFVICICSHGNKPKVAKECAGCLILTPHPPEYGGVSLLLLNSASAQSGSSKTPRSDRRDGCRFGIN